MGQKNKDVETAFEKVRNCVIQKRYAIQIEKQI